MQEYKRPINILSLDFDYFVQATEEVRDSKFPSVDSEMTVGGIISHLNYWNDYYTKYPEITKITLDKEKISKALINIKKSKPSATNIFVARSHKSIMEYVIKDLVTYGKINIVNVDHHHDMHYTGGDKLNCSNWLRLTKELFSQDDIHVTWIKNEDSVEIDITGDKVDIPCITTNINHIAKYDYDYIFICLSPEWTPFHLATEYLEFINSVLGTK